MLLDLVSLSKKYSLDLRGVIHIGAHYGQENKIYDELNIEHRIFFEPLSSNFSILEQRVDSRYHLIKKALGNENKTVEMFVEVANKGQSSSILKPSKHLLQYPQIQFPFTEEVEMSRLDDLGLDLSFYNFINIDVQGYELEVFKGAEKTLEKIDFIISEVNREELYENCAKIWDLQNFLTPYGFHMQEVNWAGQTWGDAFFLKEK